MTASGRRRRLFTAGATGLLLFALAVATQYVGATYGAGVPAPPAVRPEQVPAAERDRLRLVEGVPVVHLAGSPYEVGLQHGRILAPQIRYLYTEYFEGLAIPAVGRERLEEWAARVEPLVPTPYREEMRGLAAGSGLTEHQVLLVNTMVDKLQSLMCSTVVASGDATRDGEIYFGRNLDFFGRNILHRTTVVLVFEPEGATPLAAVTWPGLVGILSGMNARGVTGATMMIHRGKALRPGIPYMIMYRDALARAEKTSDVGDLVTAATRTCPNNFMVVDATGRAELLEIDQDLVARRAPEDGGLCSTNHFRSPALPDVGWPLGKSRYESLTAFLAREHGRIDLELVKGALRDVARPWLLNVQAMVFLPARRSIHLAVGEKLPAAAQPYVHLPAELLFASEPADTGR